MGTLLRAMIGVAAITPMAAAIFVGIGTSDAVAQGMNRHPSETPDQCRARLYPNYNSKVLSQCIAACRDCYTTSGGANCESFCRGIGATDAPPRPAAPPKQTGVGTEACPYGFDPCVSYLQRTKGLTSSVANDICKRSCAPPR